MFLVRLFFHSAIPELKSSVVTRLGHLNHVLTGLSGSELLFKISGSDQP